MTSTAKIETVLGPLSANDLGRVLIHEHLAVRCDQTRVQCPHLFDDAAELKEITREVRRAMSFGVRTLVDPTCLDIGRNVRLLKCLSEQTGLQIITCTGILGFQNANLPRYFQNRGVEALTDCYVHEIERGIQGTGIKAGFIKCGVDAPGVTAPIEKALRASARASLRTGCPIMAHSHLATRRGLEEVEIFTQEGVAPGLIQIAHTGDTADLGYIEELLRLAAACGSAWIGSGCTTSSGTRRGSARWRNYASAATPIGCSCLRTRSYRWTIWGPASATICSKTGISPFCSSACSRTFARPA
jgi:phosphotriesterase-related protein